MSVQIIMDRDIYLDAPVTPVTLTNPIYAGDADAQRIRFRCFQKHGNIAPMDLSEITITAHFIRPDGGDVVITGTGGSTYSYVDLPEACYVYPGIFKLLVRASTSTPDVVTSVLYVTGRIDKPTTDVIIDPGTTIPSLEDLLAQIDACEAAEEAANAAAASATAAAAAGVRTDTDAQGLTDTQKLNARTNIGAADADTVSQLSEEIKLSEIVLTPTWTDGKYVAGENVEIAHANYSIADFDVSGIRGKIKISTYGSSSVGWILLDSNDAQIERSLFTNSTGDTYNFVREVDLKANSYKLRVSCHTAEKSDQIVCYLVETNDIVPFLCVATTDFNTVPTNSIITCEVGNLSAASNHVPYDQFHGSIMTVGQTTASKQQFAISYHNRAFTRRYFSSSWSQWNEIASITPLSASSSTDLDTVTSQFTNIGVSSLTASTNHVPYDGFQGQVYTVVSGSNWGNQIAVSYTSEMYLRTKYVSWSGWVLVSDKNGIEPLKNDYCVLSEFDNIFCAGDSLTWGAVYTGSGSNDFRQAKKPYNEVLQLRTGVTTARNAQPGIDAIGYVSKLSSITEKTNQLCIIYLGTNGGLTDTIDTDAPGTDKTQYDLTTETGSYCYIVKHCLDVGAKVLLVKIYRGGGSSGVSTTNTVIGKVAEKFGVAVVENETLPDKYHIWPNGQGYDTTHLNDFGYAAFAEYLIRQINMMSATMMARILPDS